MVGEQRKSRNRFALNKTRGHPSTTTSTGPHQLPGQPSTTRKRHKADRQQVNPLQAFPLWQPQNRRPSAIGKTNQPAKPDKKILDTKALDKVYINYQSAMTPT